MILTLFWTRGQYPPAPPQCLLDGFVVEIEMETHNAHGFKAALEEIDGANRPDTLYQTTCIERSMRGRPRRLATGGTSMNFAELITLEVRVKSRGRL